MFFKYLVEMVYTKPFLPSTNLTKILLQGSVQNFVEMDLSVWSLTWSHTHTHKTIKFYLLFSKYEGIAQKSIKSASQLCGFYNNFYEDFPFKFPLMAYESSYTNTIYT